MIGLFNGRYIARSTVDVFSLFDSSLDALGDDPFRRLGFTREFLEPLRPRTPVVPRPLLEPGLALCCLVIDLLYIQICMKCSFRNIMSNFLFAQPALSEAATSSFEMASSVSSCMKAKASWGTGFCHTGANDWRCSGVGPSSRSAARCLGVL